MTYAVQQVPRSRRVLDAVAIGGMLWTVSVAESVSAQSATQSAGQGGAAASALPDTSAITPEMVDKGRRLYHGKGTCIACHGTKLEVTPVAPAHRKTSGWKAAKDGAFPELVRVISTGVPGTLMVAFPNGISPSETVLVASYIWAVNHRGTKP